MSSTARNWATRLRHPAGGTRFRTREGRPDRPLRRGLPFHIRPRRRVGASVHREPGEGRSARTPGREARTAGGLLGMGRDARPIRPTLGRGRRFVTRSTGSGARPQSGTVDRGRAQLRQGRGHGRDRGGGCRPVPGRSLRPRPRRGSAADRRGNGDGARPAPRPGPDTCTGRGPSAAFPGDSELAEGLLAIMRGQPSPGLDIAVDLQMLAASLEGTSEDSSGGYIDLVTGDVFDAAVIDFGDEEIDVEAEPDRWLGFDRVEPGEAWTDMSVFVARLHQAELRERGRAAIEGKGAFQRFRTFIHESGLRDEW